MNIRPPFIVTSILLLSPISSSAQVLDVRPAMPKIGDQISIIYDETAPAATLKGMVSLEAQVMLVAVEGMPKLVAIPLSKSTSTWTGSLKLDYPETKLIVALVVAGDQCDNNNGKAWSALVGSSIGQPVENANVAYARFLTGSLMGNFKHEKDFPQAFAAIRKEEALYPSNWRAYPLEWSILVYQSKSLDVKPNLRGAVDSCFDRFKGNDLAVSEILEWFGQVGESSRADSIRTLALRNEPRSFVARRTRHNEIMAERDPRKRADMIEKFLKDFSLIPFERTSMERILFGAYYQSSQPEKALAVAERISELRTDMYNQIAWDWIEKGMNLEKATALAKRAVDDATDTPDSIRPSSMSEKDWRESVSSSRASVLDTYGFGLYKLGNVAEAEKAFEGAYHGSKGESPDITERLLMTYNKEGKYEKAAGIGQEAVDAGKTNDNVLKYYTEAYVKVHGSIQGYNAIIAAARMKAESGARAMAVKNRMAKPEIPFELKGLDGTLVKLSDLKGKVVVIDFWATWCGPCKMSFPTLQKVYEHYAANDNVRILALDTWERVDGTERTDLVKKFIAENKYAFPVLFDKDAVDRYGVDGIPTKFIIDKKGNIAFKSVGFIGENEMLSELTTQIDYLLAE